MLRDIPKPTRPVYKGNWRKPYNPTPHTGPEATHDTSRRHFPLSKKYDTQIRELRIRRSDIHTGPKTAHTDEN
jgi:hypothetical protein